MKNPKGTRPSIILFVQMMGQTYQTWSYFHLLFDLWMTLALYVKNLQNLICVAHEHQVRHWQRRLQIGCQNMVLTYIILWGQGYDGAGNMADKFNGTAATIQGINPKALCVPCNSHVP